MAVLAFLNVRGEPQGDRIDLGRRRRRLSSLVARHVTTNRPFVVSVHRGVQPDDVLAPTDDTVRLRQKWKDTLIGANDVVLVTLLPLGRSMGGGRGAGKQIGMAVGMLALAIAVPWAVGALGTTALGGIGSLTFAGKAVAAGLTAGIHVGPSYTLKRSVA